jgi:hypothetical protein
VTKIVKRRFSPSGARWTSRLLSAASVAARSLSLLKVPARISLIVFQAGLLPLTSRASTMAAMSSGWSGWAGCDWAEEPGPDIPGPPDPYIADPPDTMPGGGPDGGPPDPEGLPDIMPGGGPEGGPDLRPIIPG